MCSLLGGSGLWAPAPGARKGRVRSSPILGSDVDLKSCLLSFQVFEEVLSPTSVSWRQGI